MAEVEYRHATRIYPGTTIAAVSGLDLDIHDGEFMVLVGPSGSGKSTALRMLAGLEAVDEGQIMIGDRDVTDVQPKDRDIAMVFQKRQLVIGGQAPLPGPAPAAVSSPRRSRSRARTAGTGRTFGEKSPT